MVKKSFAANLDRLDKLGDARADALVGPAPTEDLEKRIAFAEQLEQKGGKAPLAAVVPLNRGESPRSLLTYESGYRLYQPDMPVAVGDRLEVPRDRLRSNEWNSRFFYFDKDINERSVSLAADGQLLAVQVYPPVDGVFELHDGETRWRALRGNIKVEVVARDPNPLVRFKQARTLNTERKAQTVFDDAVKFRQVLEQKLIEKQEDIAVMFSLHPAYVSKVLSIGEMPRHLLERMASNADQFGIANAYSLYQFWTLKEKDDEAAAKLISKVVDGKLSVRELNNLLHEVKDRAAPQGGPGRKRERPLSRAAIQSGGKGELKAFPDGKIQLELSEVPEANRALLFNRILQLFEECGMKYDSVNPPVQPASLI
jgi:ParB family transcriptional regulator, chromosome partitioning protein